MRMAFVRVMGDPGRGRSESGLGGVGKTEGGSGMCHSPRRSIPRSDLPPVRMRRMFLWKRALETMYLPLEEVLALK